MDKKLPAIVAELGQLPAVTLSFKRMGAITRAMSTEAGVVFTSLRQLLRHPLLWVPTCHPMPPCHPMAERWIPLPCRGFQPDLWFSEIPVELDQAKRLCGLCPVRVKCLSGALLRGEPCGVWGGELFENGEIIPFKRPRGRTLDIKTVQIVMTVMARAPDVL